ncbi:hypothetical protein [Enterococcus sp. DIV0800]|uniref:hypothetical protein n=1 Tax=unclassified Enterococcus TaxID=2608891 RepID=UPI003D2FAE2B
MNIDKALGILAESAHHRKLESQQNQLQRRNQVTDLFGVEHQAQGDAQTPATFYVSISPDLIYYERFEFKLIISKFAMPLAGNGSTGKTAVTIDKSNLSISGSAISPNPHSHTSQEHNHSLPPGISLFTPSITNFRIKMDGIDLTEAFKQQSSDWITGEGIFPKSSDPFATFDVLKAMEHLYTWQQGVILAPGYKKVELINDGGPFNATLVNYLKYSHVNR